MSYDLAIYRVGAMTQLANGADGILRRPTGDNLEGEFAKQRDRIPAQPAYCKAMNFIKDAANKFDGNADFLPRDDAPERDNQISIFSMPPALDLPPLEDLDHSSHLVGLIPSERLALRIAETDWIVRIRASVTACALEVANGLPKLWWTFEAVPKNRNPDCRPSEEDTAAFLSFVRDLETPALEYLNAAYFGALKEITGVGTKLTSQLGNERLRIRFADNNDIQYAALIYALKFRKLTAMDIERAKPAQLQPARQGMLGFKKFVNDTNSPTDPINPETAHLDREIKIAGVEAISARRDCPVSNSTWIAGVTQRPRVRTAYDHLYSVREQRVAEYDEWRVRAFSAARRFSGQLAAIEALKLEYKRRNIRSKVLAAAV
jgi:hypothetical protein